MKENFVIREERHPIGLAIETFASIMKFICFIMFFVALSMGVPVITALIGIGLVYGCWWIVGKVCENLCKEFYYCEFEVDGLKVTYEYDGGFPVLTVNGDEEQVIVGYSKFPNGERHPDPSVTKGGFVRRRVLRSHELKLFHGGSERYPDCYILLDGVIIVEHGMVYVDKIHEILSGLPASANQPLPVDAGVMPPFQTTPLYRSAESTVAPRTKRYAIVGQAGVFENRRFDVTTTLVLGRDAVECGLVFPADTAGVSRVHCKLVVEADGLWVYDLGSTYGTAVNNNKTISANQMMKLNHGDTITIGSNQTFVVLYS